MSKFLALIAGVSLAFYHIREVQATLATWKTPQWSALGILTLFLIISVSISNANKSRQ